MLWVSAWDCPRKRYLQTLDKYGNISSATMAVALDEPIKGNIVGPGDIVLIVAFGSGLTWAGVTIKL